MGLLNGPVCPVPGLYRLADAIAYGRQFIANPDLVRRFAEDQSLNTYDRASFYGGTARGYTDYPALVDKARLFGPSQSIASNYGLTARGSIGWDLHPEQYYDDS